MNTKYLFTEQLGNLSYLENLYQEYLQSPSLFDPGWRVFFQNIEVDSDTSHRPSSRADSKASKIEVLLRAYRQNGHLRASTNPLAFVKEREESSRADLLQHCGFDFSDLERIFSIESFFGGSDMTLGQIVDLLERRYCGSIGFELDRMRDDAAKQWILGEVESERFDSPFSPEDRLSIFSDLMRAECLETFLHTKHVGKKRFSLEGGETLIPMLIFFVARARQEGVQEIFFGMSHRGRLNVIANVLQRSVEELLMDFDEEYVPHPKEGMGDIRYHKGYINTAVKTRWEETIKLSICSNPSHLESIDTVIEGQTKASQLFSGDEKEEKK